MIFGRTNGTGMLAPGRAPFCHVRKHSRTLPRLEDVWKVQCWEQNFVLPASHEQRMGIGRTKISSEMREDQHEIPNLSTKHLDRKHSCNIPPATRNTQVYMVFDGWVGCETQTSWASSPNDPATVRIIHRSRIGMWTPDMRGSPQTSFSQTLS